MGGSPTADVQESPPPSLPRKGGGTLSRERRGTASRDAQTSPSHHTLASVGRSLVIALTAFLTIVDLFAAQAILPTLVRRYGVSPAEMALAVNASTLGMAVAGLAVAFLSRRLDRRLGILASLTLLAIPTALLAWAPDLTTFALLRIAQGVFMAAAFSLTLAYLGEHYGTHDAANAFAAYITGNVASNLVGRFVSAGVAEHAGLAANFYVFTALNIAGALLVYFTVQRVPRNEATAKMPPMAAWREHVRDPALRAGFGIGFCILFAFIGTFTFVNFVLVREPLSLGSMQLGIIYLVFLPSILTTPLAGRAAERLGTRPALWTGLAIAAAGLPLMLAPSLPLVLAGMVLIGVGTFLAQAIATGFVGRTATADRASASGIYLACYFLGGLVGTAVLGHVFDRFGWAFCVAGIGMALLCAAILAARLR